MPDGRRILARWRSRTNRACLLVQEFDGTPIGLYELTSERDLPEILETFALEVGLNLALDALTDAREAIYRAKLEREAFKRGLARIGPNGATLDLGTEVDEAGHAFANALTRFERTWGPNRPGTEELGPPDRGRG